MVIYLKKQLEKSFVPLDSINNLVDNIVTENSINKSMNPRIKNYTIFLNFNYTNIEDYYVKELKDAFPDEVKSIHIHGELNNAINPVIFGYDDEKDVEFNEIKNSFDSGYSENVKTINYIITGNYNELVKFIENNEYEVYVLGHSCGISDRTILSKIIDTDNCKSIKIYYYVKDGNSTDHKDKVINISRMFPLNTNIINKIVPQDKCEELSNIKKLLPDISIN